MKINAALNNMPGLLKNLSTVLESIHAHLEQQLDIQDKILCELVKLNAKIEIKEDTELAE